MIVNQSEERPGRASAQRIKHSLLVIVSALAVLIASSIAAGTAMATPANGVSQTPIASGLLPEPVRVKIKYGTGFGDGLEISNVSIVKNVIAPGGYFGWHQHGGPSWIVVTSGQLTFYDADDPSCGGHIVRAGEAFLDLGSHTHNARNETAAPVENYVVRMLPAGAPSRIDMPAPDTCDF
jgi:hypothetical protein